MLDLSFANSRLQNFVFNQVVKYVAPPVLWDPIPAGIAGARVRPSAALLTASGVGRLDRSEARRQTDRGHHPG
jgi:hypothetical protein